MLLVFALAIVTTSIMSHVISRRLGLPTASAAYRRIGPTSGSQAFCAGSSLLQFSLDWEKVSSRLGQGIENWGLGGSTPVEWEIFQKRQPKDNPLIIGISLYDSNENRFCDARANLVPFPRAVNDLRQSGSNWQFVKRVLGQYPLAYARILFPTAGRSDAVLVGLRKEIREIFHLSSTADDRAITNFLRQDNLFKFGDSFQRVSEWDQGKLLRRLSLSRNENRGLHSFDGPKMLATIRMITYAKQRGGVIVIVVPVSPSYLKEFTTPKISEQFAVLCESIKKADPNAQIIRLDNDPRLQSDRMFDDLVHLNAFGREIATEDFLTASVTGRKIRQ